MGPAWALSGRHKNSCCLETHPTQQYSKTDDCARLKHLRHIITISLHSLFPLGLPCCCIHPAHPTFCPLTLLRSHTRAAWHCMSGLPLHMLQRPGAMQAPAGTMGFQKQRNLQRLTSTRKKSELENLDRSQVMLSSSAEA